MEWREKSKARAVDGAALFVSKDWFIWKLTLVIIKGDFAIQSRKLSVTCGGNCGFDVPVAFRIKRNSIPINRQAK